jgi:hypothetical protein
VASEQPIGSRTQKPASSATLIYGEHDAILIDTPATHGQVDALTDWIESKGRPLSRIFGERERQQRRLAGSGRGHEHRFRSARYPSIASIRLRVDARADRAR